MCFIYKDMDFGGGVLHPNSYVESLTPGPQNVTAFGHRAFKEVFNLNGGFWIEV